MSIKIKRQLTDSVSDLLDLLKSYGCNSGYDTSAPERQLDYVG